MCQGVRLWALWSVVSVRRLLVCLTIDAAACRVRLCLGARLRALWAVVSVGRLLVRLAIDGAASAVGRCARGFAFGRSGPLCWRRKLLPAGYLSVCPAIDTVASRRVRSRLLGSGGSLGSDADAAIIGGIQRTEPRHVGGAPGSAARLSVGRALLIGQAIVVGFVCPANPNR